MDRVFLQPACEEACNSPPVFGSTHRERETDYARNI